jgi:acetylornithine/succinyldiaminopimelate/putrescine aminotransferase
MGAFWVGEKFANVLSAGTHATTFGGTPLACAVALKIFDVIERENLVKSARDTGDFLLRELRTVQHRSPKVVKVVRGLGLMIGIEFQPQFKAVEIVKELHQRNLLTVPAGNSVIRLLPPLNLSRGEAEEGFRVIEALITHLSNQK